MSTVAVLVLMMRVAIYCYGDGGAKPPDDDDAAVISFLLHKSLHSK